MEASIAHGLTRPARRYNRLSSGMNLQFLDLAGMISGADQPRAVISDYNALTLVSVLELPHFRPPVSFHSRLVAGDRAKPVKSAPVAGPAAAKGGSLKKSGPITAIPFGMKRVALKIMSLVPGLNVVPVRFENPEEYYGWEDEDEWWGWQAPQPAKPFRAVWGVDVAEQGFGGASGGGSSDSGTGGFGGGINKKRMEEMGFKFG